MFDTCLWGARVTNGTVALGRRSGVSCVRGGPPVARLPAVGTRLRAGAQWAIRLARCVPRAAAWASLPSLAFYIYCIGISDGAMGPLTARVWRHVVLASTFRPQRYDFWQRLCH